MSNTASICKAFRFISIFSTHTDDNLLAEFVTVFSFSILCDAVQGGTDQVEVVRIRDDVEGGGIRAGLHDTVQDKSPEFLKEKTLKK